ncbi:MAG TPA: hypothetical protein DGA22_10520 [Acidobacterium sp.]|nr:hypothetical protein [Acidobacterium sp.]
MRSPGTQATVPSLCSPHSGLIQNTAACVRATFSFVEKIAAARWETHCLCTAASLQARNAALNHPHTGAPRCMHSRFASAREAKKDV